VVGSKEIEANNPFFGISTTGEIFENLYYYIADCQLGRIRTDGTSHPLEELKETIILRSRLK
jgi:hypothetical protein